MPSDSMTQRDAARKVTIIALIVLAVEILLLIAWAAEAIPFRPGWILIIVTVGVAVWYGNKWAGASNAPEDEEPHTPKD